MSVATTEQVLPSRTYRDVATTLIRGKGKVEGEALTTALDALRAADTYASAELALAEQGEAHVAELSAQIASAREAIATSVREADATVVSVARIAYVLADPTVRGVKSLTGKELADAWGVSAGRVSQVLAIARAMAETTWSAGAYRSLMSAYKSGGRAALDAAVTGAQSQHAARTAGEEGSSAVSTSDVVAAIATPVDKPSTVRASALSKYLDNVAGADVFDGFTPEYVAQILGNLERIARRVQAISDK